MTENPFEIPQVLRDVAEQNMKQAQAAYEQLTDFVTKAMDAWMGETPSNSMVTDFNVTGFEDVQDRAVAMATKNAELGFRSDRKDRQGTNSPRHFDASDAVCSRADASLRCADAGASKADGGSFPKAATRLI